LFVRKLGFPQAEESGVCDYFLSTDWIPDIEVNTLTVTSRSAVLTHTTTKTAKNGDNEKDCHD
jgi:hypothetical protein